MAKVDFWTIMDMRDMKKNFNSREEYVAHCKAENRAFFEANRGRYLVEYVREGMPFKWGYPDLVLRERGRIYTKGKGTPTAVMVAYRGEAGEISVGWSAAHPTKERHFNRDIGRYKAITRLRPIHLGIEPELPIRLDSPMADFMMYAQERLGPKVEVVQ